MNDPEKEELTANKSNSSTSEVIISDEVPKETNKGKKGLWADYGEAIILIAITLGAVFALTVGMQVVLNTEYPQVAVTTKSMMPVYNGFLDYEGGQVHHFRGDLLIIQRAATYEIGDTIVFTVETHSIPIVHRIIRVRQDESGSCWFLTRGDNNGRMDSGALYSGWVSQEAIHGKVILRIPYIGWLSLQLQTLEGRVIILILAAILLFLSFSDEEEEEPQDKEPFLDKWKRRCSLDWIKILPDITPKWAATKAGITTLVILILICSFFLFNFVIMFGGCDATVTLINENKEISTDRTKPTVLDFTTSRSDALPTIEGRIFYIDLTVRSAGWFNSINHVDIYTDDATDDSHEGRLGHYQWNIVYEYWGDKTVGAGFYVDLPKPDVDIDIKITLVTTPTGLLNQGQFIKTYYMTLEA